MYIDDDYDEAAEMADMHENLDIFEDEYLDDDDIDDFLYPDDYYDGDY